MKIVPLFLELKVLSIGTIFQKILGIFNEISMSFLHLEQLDNLRGYQKNCFQNIPTIIWFAEGYNFVKILHLTLR